MYAVWIWLESLPAVVGVLFGATLATIGWLYTARRTRSLLRRQHTFNALLTVTCNVTYQAAHNRIRSMIRAKSVPDLPLDGDNQTRDDLSMLLNHFEFLAAGLRNGDMAERLLRDSDRGTIIGLVEAADSFIQKVRNSRQRKAIFEHLEWLHDRWQEKPPVWWQRVIEALLGRPLRHDVHRWYWLGAAAAMILVIFIIWVHLPSAPASP